MNLKLKDIVLIAIFSAILFIQEELLSFLPNIQLTVFLLILFSYKFGLFKTLIIVSIHTLLDNLLFGSFNVYVMPFMFIGWAFIPIISCTLFKKVKSNIALSFISILYSFLYSWVFIIPNCLMLKIDFLAYITSDILFETLLAVSSFISTLLLYNPLSRLFDRYYLKK